MIKKMLKVTVALVCMGGMYLFTRSSQSQPLTDLTKANIEALAQGIQHNEIMFPTQDFKSLKGNQLLPDLFIGQPYKMLFVKNKLYFIDKHEDRLLTVIDFEKNNEIKRIVNHGDGPNEFLQIRDIVYNPIDNAMTLVDKMDRSISLYRLENRDLKLNNSHFLAKHRFNESKYIFFDIVPFGKNFIANGCFDGKQFALFDSNTNIKSLFGVYPGDNNGVQNPLGFFLKNQTIIQTNPSQTHFVAAGVYHDQLVFYKTNGNELIKVKEYFSIDSNLLTKTSKSGKENFNHSELKPETIRAYMTLYATDKLLYALYWGIKNKDIEKKNQICYLLKFDWDGNLKKGFKMDRKIKYFAVDEKNETIYAITPSYEEEPILLQYKM